MKTLLVILAFISCTKQPIIHPVQRNPEQKKVVAIQLKQTFFVDVVINDSCTQEVVFLHGIINFTYSSTQMGDILNLHANFVYNLIGVGQTSGKEYKLVGHQTFTEKYDVNDDLTTFLQFNRKTILIGDNNLTATQTYHFVTDSQGNVKVAWGETNFNLCK